MSYFDGIWRVWVKGGAPSKWVDDAEKECKRIFSEIETEAETRRAQLRARQAREEERARQAWRERPEFLFTDKPCIHLEETKMQKEYEYKATGKGGVGPYDIYKYNPCDTEFGKFTKWFYNLPSPPSSVDLVAKLVEEKRFDWLDWLATNTPFVTRTEKKPAYKFTPENLKLEFYKDGGAALMMYDEKGDDWWYTLHFVPGEPISRSEDVGRVPVPLDVDSKVRVR